MTAPSPATLEREKDKLYVTDAELIRRLGVPEKIMRGNLRMLDRNPKSGFPKKDPLYGGRRYMPAVEAWFDNYNRLNMQPSQPRRAQG